MPALEQSLEPSTVFKIAEIEQYSPKLAHFELQQGGVIQKVLCLLWIYDWAIHFSSK